MAARFCSQCGREIATSAQFCPACGAAANGPGQQPVTRVQAATSTTHKALVPAMAAALLVLVIVVAVLAGKARQSVLSAPAAAPPAAPSVLAAPPAAPPAAPAVTNAPSEPAPVAPAVTNAPSKPLPALPPEDARYLAFLQEIEQRRIALANDTSAAVEMQDAARGLQSQESDPEQQDQQGGNIQKSFGKLNQGYSDYLSKWQALTADFRRVQPPVDCTEIANHYYTALVDYSDIISKTQVILKNVNLGSTPDMNALLQAQATLQEAQTKVNSDLTGADGAIAQLCTQYDVPKPFSIQVNGASSPLTGM